MKRLLVVLLFTGSMHAAVAPGWVQYAMKQPPGTQPAGTEAVVLLDATTLTISPDGEMTTLRQRIVKVLTPAGREHAYGGAAFDDRTRLRRLQGWSIDSAGKVTLQRERDAVEASTGTFEVFTDARMKVLDLSVDVGGVIAYEYETREKPYELASIWGFQEPIPVLHARFEAKLPPGWTFDAAWFGFPAVTPSAGPVWELRDIPAIADEERMPEAGVAGWMGVRWGSKRTWSDVAAWYHGLAVPRLAATPPLKARVRSLTAGAPDPVRAVARFAQRDVRYVAVEIGIGGYQPHAAGDVLANAYGDCKDKATLLKAMLKELGVESHYVLVHTTRGAVEPSFPFVHAFNHVITAIQIPKESAREHQAVLQHPQLGTLLLFDPTSTTTPFGQLPPWLQSSRGLLVTGNGGEMIELPGHPPEASALRRTAKLELEANGTLRGSVEEIRTGAIAVSVRAALQQLNSSERVKYIESSLANHLASQTATEVRIENIDEPEQDLVFRYKLAAPGYAQHVAGMLLIRPRVLGTKSGRPIPASGRRYPYETEGPSVHTDEVEIALPANVALDELPKPVEVATPQLHYASSSRFENGVLRYSRRYAMKTYIVETDAIPALNAAFARIAADERASAVFK